MSEILPESVAKAMKFELDQAEAFRARCLDNIEKIKDKAPLVRRLEKAGFQTWINGPTWLYVNSDRAYNPDRSRALFSEDISKLKDLLCEAPDVTMDEFHLTARFEVSKVELYMSVPNDCKFIEETTEVVIRRPHPSCLAALRELEN